MTKFSTSSRQALRIDLVRHGRVEERWRGHIYGDLDVDLSEAGREQSRRVARIFEGTSLDGVLSSGLRRSLFGACAIARAVGIRDEAVQFDSRFKELHRGDWKGFGEAQVEERQPGGWQAWQISEGMLVPPAGETHSLLRERVCTGLDDWARAHPGEHWALVAHKWVLRVALAEALGLGDSRLPRLEVPTSGVLSLVWPARPVEANATRVGGIEVLGLGSTTLPAGWARD